MIKLPVNWTLRRLLATKHQIYSAAELQTRLAQRTGTYIPINLIEGLLKREAPNYVRVKVLEALCNALECDLGDFCSVTPDPPHHQEPTGA